MKIMETKDTKTLEDCAGGAYVCGAPGEIAWLPLSEHDFEIACENFRKEMRPEEYRKERQELERSRYDSLRSLADSGCAMAVSSSLVTSFFTTLALQEGRLGLAALTAGIGGILGVAGYVTHRSNLQPKDTAYAEYQACGGKQNDTN